MRTTSALTPLSMRSHAIEARDLRLLLLSLGASLGRHPMRVERRARAVPVALQHVVGGAAEAGR